MKKLAISLSMAFTAVALAGAPAMAQQYSGSIKTRTSSLDHATWHKAPLQLQAIDNRPIFTDHRIPDQGPNVIEVNLAPLPTQPGNHIVYGTPSAGAGQGMTPFKTNNPNLGNLGLAPLSEMHQSNISSRPAVNTANLPNGIGIGVHTMQHVNGHLAAPTRPIAIASNSAPIAISAAPKTYGSYTNPGQAYSSNSITTKTAVIGKITSPVISRLKSNY